MSGAERTAADIPLGSDSHERTAVIRPQACLNFHRERHVANKPTLLAMLELQVQMVAAASVEPAVVDRETYDALWTRWYALEAQAHSP